jgi:CRP-like cAMP-binding protein
MFMVKEGEVEIIKYDKVIDRVGPGGIFGEMALIDISPRSATATAKSDCILVPVDEYNFLFLVQHTPYFSLQVMRSLVERLRALMSVTAK